MASAAALTSLTGMIPIAVAGGMVLKFTQAGMPQRNGYTPRRRRSTRRRRPRSLYSNGFSNVGF